MEKKIDKRSASNKKKPSPSDLYHHLIGSLTGYAILILDAEGTIITLNDGALALKRCTREDVVGKHFSIFHFPSETYTHNRTLELARNTGQFHEEGWRVRVDGSRFFASVIISPILSKQGHLVGFSKIIRDLSEQKEAEIRNKEQQARRADRSKLASLGEMAAGFGHEINNPLAAIQATAEDLAEQLRETILPQEYLIRKLERIESTCSRIALIVQSLRRFARNDAGAPFSEAVFSEILSDTISFCSEKFKNQGVEFKIEGDWPGIKLHCRPVEISQVLLNLLNNAFDAVKDQDIKSISLHTKVTGDKIQIRIKDTGPGIDELTASRIFQPFFTTKEPGKGSGLGLSISAAIVRDHGGTLKLVPSENGAEFLLTLKKTQRDRAPQVFLEELESNSQRAPGISGKA